MTMTRADLLCFLLLSIGPLFSFAICGLLIWIQIELVRSGLVCDFRYLFQSLHDNFCESQ